MNIDDFGTELRKIRQHRRMTQRQLGAHCSAAVAQGSVHQYESSERYPSIKTLVEMAAALGIDEIRIDTRRERNDG
jgi:transcriptional regulator with XRE-family HTH domain